MKRRLLGAMGVVAVAVVACGGGGAAAPVSMPKSAGAMPAPRPTTAAPGDVGSEQQGAGPDDSSAGASKPAGGGGGEDDAPPASPAPDQEMPDGNDSAPSPSGAPSDTASLHAGSSSTAPLPPPGPSSPAAPTRPARSTPAPAPAPAACRVPTLPATRPSAADTAKAQALFDEARRLMEQGKFADACPKLAACESLDPAVGTLLNLALCEEKKGDLVAARAHYEDACGLATSKNDAARVQFARQKMADLDAQLARQRTNF